jgi:hypothetical protein
MIFVADNQSHGAHFVRRKTLLRGEVFLLFRSRAVGFAVLPEAHQNAKLKPLS